ncbi:MAG: hypothetical protein JW800_03185 [Candidatus Omnitrophica bacterium]|nr:hypothetical protein [Candidatus Omnitrophota bacterium]
MSKIAIPILVALSILSGCDYQVGYKDGDVVYDNGSADLYNRGYNDGYAGFENRRLGGAYRRGYNDGQRDSYEDSNQSDYFGN